MFNPEARWDRSMPQDDTFCGEFVEVTAMFKAGGFSPICFIYTGRKHLIKEIYFTWKERKGRDIFYLFNVSDDNNNLYRLAFSQQSLHWRLLPDE